MVQYNQLKHIKKETQKVSKSKKVIFVASGFLLVANIWLSTIFFLGYSSSVSKAYELKQAQTDLKSSIENNRNLTLKVTEDSSLSKLENTGESWSFVPVSALDMQFIKASGMSQFSKR